MKFMNFVTFFMQNCQFEPRSEVSNFKIFQGNMPPDTPNSAQTHGKIGKCIHSLDPCPRQILVVHLKPYLQITFARLIDDEKYKESYGEMGSHLRVFWKFDKLQDNV